MSPRALWSSLLFATAIGCIQQQNLGEADFLVPGEEPSGSPADGAPSSVPSLDAAPSDVPSNDGAPNDAASVDATGPGQGDANRTDADDAQPAGDADATPCIDQCPATKRSRTAPRGHDRRRSFARVRAGHLPVRGRRHDPVRPLRDLRRRSTRRSPRRARAAALRSVPVERRHDARSEQAGRALRAPLRRHRDRELRGHAVPPHAFVATATDGARHGHGSLIGRRVRRS